MISVLAFDPGHTTGYACFELGSGIEHHKIEAATLKDWHGVHDLIVRLKPTVIVYEIFKLYNYKAAHKAWDSFLEVEVIGVIRFIAEQYNIPVIGQTPSDGKYFFNEKRLRDLGLWDKTTHVRDATGHALYCLSFNQKKINDALNSLTAPRKSETAAEAPQS